MSKNTQNFASNRKNASMTTRTLTYCALLAALQVAMARLFGLMPTEFTRFSIEAIPTILAGLLFGPVAGGLVGFVADFVGCLFSPYPYNPIFALPPVLYGVSGGLFRPFLAAAKGNLRQLLILTLTVAVPVIFGSVLYQSWALDYVYSNGFLYFLTSRSIQFAIVMVPEIIIIAALFKSRVFHHMGIWPPRKRG